MRTSIYALIRDGEKKATVVVLPNGRCVVSWPTSTIVYDSEQAARDVHITHMGGRGEPTRFELETSTSKSFLEGAMWCQMDDWENAPLGSVGGDKANPKELALNESLKSNDRDEAEVIAGYETQAAAIYGEDWREKMGSCARASRRQP